MTDLKELLDGLADEAPRYDVVARVHQRRRRHIRARRVAGGSALALTVAAAALIAGNLPDLDRAVDPAQHPDPPASVLGDCEAQRLPLPLGLDAPEIVDGVTWVTERTWVTAGDPTGRYLAGRAYRTAGDESRYQLLFWDSGLAHTIPVDGTDPKITDIDAAGNAVATSVVDGKTVSWIYRDGRMTRLPGAGAAAAVNDTGAIAGVVEDRPVVWHDPAQPPTVIHIRAGARATVSDIGPDGTIVGTLTDADGTRPYFWLPDGAGNALDLPDEMNGLQVLDVRVGAVSRNWIIGGVRGTDGNHTVSVGVRWSRNGQKWSWLSNGIADVYAADGTAAGTHDDADDPDGALHEAIRRNPDSPPIGDAFLLNSQGNGQPLPTAPGAILDPDQADATFAAISADGRVIGGHQQFQSTPDGPRRIGAVRWTCG